MSMTRLSRRLSAIIRAFAEETSSIISMYGGHVLKYGDAVLAFFVIEDESSMTRYHFILAAVRYLAAHSPTMRSQTHTYETAVQLSFGQELFE